MSAQDPKITVVGAGLAGLTTAYRLEQITGLPVDIYEARGRPGGRVYTICMNDSYEELGGKFLGDGGEAKTIKALIAEMGLEVHKNTKNLLLERKYYYEGDIGWYYAPYRDAPEPLLNYEYNNLGEVMDTLLKDKPLLRHLVELRNRNYEGNDSNDLSIYYLKSFLHFYEKNRATAHGLHTPIYEEETVKGGTALLVQKLEHSLSKPIHYNHALKIIKRRKEKILLQFENGTVIETDYLVLAIPSSTLRDITIEEDLIPPDQIHAITTLQYGKNAKILVPIADVPLNSAIFSTTERCALWFNKDVTILTHYFGGSAGQFNCGCLHTLGALIMSELPAVEALYPTITFPLGLMPEELKDVQFSSYTGPVGISWELEEFSKGSYSSWGVGQFELFDAKETHCGETVRTVFRPIDNTIFFAGEHTALDYPSTLEGAVESGERTARMLVNSIGLMSPVPGLVQGLAIVP